MDGKISFGWCTEARRRQLAQASRAGLRHWPEMVRARPKVAGVRTRRKVLMMKQRVMDGAGPREKSGQVVADPGLQGVDRFQIKSGLVHAIAWTMQHRSLTQQRSE